MADAQEKLKKFLFQKPRLFVKLFQGTLNRQEETELAEMARDVGTYLKTGKSTHRFDVQDVPWIPGHQLILEYDLKSPSGSLGFKWRF